MKLKDFKEQIAVEKDMSHLTMICKNSPSIISFRGG